MAAEVVSGSSNFLWTFHVTEKKDIVHTCYKMDGKCLKN